MVETYERLVNEDGEDVLSKVDSNLDQRSTIDLGLRPSEFMGVSIQRSNLAINGEGMIQVEIQMTYREIVSLSNLMLTVKMPQTAGRFIEGNCQDGLSRAVYNNCQLEDHMTLLVTDMAPFCNEADMKCTFYAGKVLNSDYAV